MTKRDTFSKCNPGGLQEIGEACVYSGVLWGRGRVLEPNYSSI